MSQITLQFQKVAAQLEVSLYDVKYSEHRYNQQMDTLLEMICASVVMEHQVPLKIERVSTPWQFFKLRYMPKWFTKRFPVKMDVETIDVKTIYPTLKSKLPPDLMGPLVTIMVADRGLGTFMTDTEGLTKDEWRKEVQAIQLKYSYGSFEYEKCPCCKRLFFEDR